MKFDFYEIGARKEAERIAEIEGLIKKFVDEYQIRKLLFKKTGDLYGDGKYSQNRVISQYLRTASEESLIFIKKDCHWCNANSHGYWKAEAYDLTRLRKRENADEIVKRIREEEKRILTKLENIEPLFSISASIAPYHIGEIDGREDSKKVHHYRGGVGISGGLLEVHEARRLIGLLPEGELEK